MMGGGILRAGALLLAMWAAAGAARAQEIDLFSGEPPETSRSIVLGGQVPGISRDMIGGIEVFSLSLEANRSMRSSSRGGRRVRISLPEGESATCAFPPEPDLPQEESKLLSGSVAGGGATSSCSLVVRDGGVVGQIETPSGRYRIVPVGDGAHAVVRIRTERFAPESEPRRRPDAAPDERSRNLTAPQQCDVAMNPSLPPRAFGPIRVMILYTPAAKAYSADIDADVALLMASLRRSLSAAGTGGNFSISVELAHAQMIDYAESADGGMSVDLDRLSNPGDDIFRIVPTLRQRYRADLVHMLTRANPGDGCGLGWLNTQPGPEDAHYGMSVSDIECAVSNHSFVHELGHNMGLEHDRRVSPGGDPAAYNYGYVVLDKRVRDVMAYNNACQEQDLYCERLPYFSTPRLSVDGASFGRRPSDGEGAYNIEALCRAAPAIAGFRDPFPFSMFENNDVTGREIARHKGLDEAACAAACAGDGQCAAYTYDKWNKWCFLKGTVTGLRIEPRAVSGVRPELGEPPRSDRPVDLLRYRGRHFPGRGYASLYAPGMEACEQLCRADGHCMGYTHYASENRCEVFSSLGEYFPRSGADSGAKMQKAAAAD